jgi:nucleoside-diphosphate-sugar epimerase
MTQTGLRVRALVRNPARAQRLAQLGAEIWPGDITAPATLAPAMAGCQVVFHAAAWVSEDGPPAEVWAVNVTGAQNMIEAATAAGTIERFVHLSSCAVYGSLQQLGITEETPTRLRGNPYSDSKVAAEEVVMQAYARHGLPVVSARASQVYGPGSPQFTIRPVEVIRAGKMMLVDGGKYLCKPVFIDNLIDGLILCAQVEAAIGQAINLTDDAPVPWRDFFGAYGRMLGRHRFPSVPFPVAWGVALLNEIMAGLRGQKTGLNRKAVLALRSRNSFSNQKAKQLLGWQPQADLAEGMRRTEAWLWAEGYLDELT